MTLDDYASEQTFVAKLKRLMAPLADSSVPVLAVLPEDIGSFLALAGQPFAVRSARSLEQAFTHLAIRRLPSVLRWRLTGGAADLRTAVHLTLAPEVGAMYEGAVARLARELGLWLVGGSALLPPWRPDAPPYRPAEARVYNTSVTADPDGRIVHRVRKVNLVPTQEDHLGLSAAPAEEAGVFPFPGGRVGVAICYDAFVRPHTATEPDFCPLVPRLATAGATIVAQPAANPWPWDAPWELDRRRIRREQWEQESLEAALLAAPTVRYGVTAHLLADFLGVHFEGPSVILGRDASGGVRRLARAPMARAAAEAECLLAVRVPV